MKKLWEIYFKPLIRPVVNKTRGTINVTGGQMKDEDWFWRWILIQCIFTWESFDIQPTLVASIYLAKKTCL